MALNKEFGFNTKNGQDKINLLYQRAYSRAIDMHGVRSYYLPLTINKDYIDKVFSEMQNKNYESIYELKMLPEEQMSYGSHNELFSKFNLEISDEMTLFISRISFYQELTGEEITGNNFTDLERLNQSTKPQIGDLIYIPFWDSIFCVDYVENEENKIMGKAFWKLVCKKWEPTEDTYINLDVTGQTISQSVINYLNNFIDNTYTEDKDFTETGADIDDIEVSNKEIENEADHNIESEDKSDYFGNW
jgi:hypothetical protein